MGEFIVNYLNISIRLLDEPEFGLASNAQLGAWMRLAGYCAQRENFGVIESCHDWPERLWLKTVGIDAEDVSKDSSLWHWKDGNLIVHFFPKEQQFAAQHLRAMAKTAAKKRWKKSERNADTYAARHNGTAMRKDKDKGNGKDNLHLPRPMPV